VVSCEGFSRWERRLNGGWEEDIVCGVEPDTTDAYEDRIRGMKPL
jgi:hypothetical protein